jgi:hypothetical protein
MGTMLKTLFAALAALLLTAGAASPAGAASATSDFLPPDQAFKVCGCPKNFSQ